MKKMIALLLAAMMVLSMAACASKTAETAAPADTAEPAAASTAAAADSDLAYIQDKGTLVIGITDFEPMDYKDADGSWIGFDADMAKAFAESLGVTAEFVEIDWDNKILELDSKTIDCVWNGMTLTAEVTSTMECSNAYCNNAQVVIVPADKASEYQTVESVKDLTFAAEAGSAGEAELTALGYTVTPVKAQSDALMEVAAGTSDAAVIDSLMAAAMVGEGTGYASLTYTCGLNSEEYGVGFRKGSDLAQKLNKFFQSSYADGSMMQIAETYGVQEALLPQETSEFTASEADSDVAYIQDKGTLIVGITNFAPMDYEETAGSGEWIGFDADMAKLVAEKLGVEIQFVEIEWDNKVFELNGKTIDVVWNGMTLTDAVMEAMECTNAYCQNAQVVISK